MGLSQRCWGCEEDIGISGSHGLAQTHSLSLSVCRMETFPAVAEEVLREFQVLLQHSPPPIGSTRMLQLVAINMFAVYNSQPKGMACPQGAGQGLGLLYVGC